MRRNNLNNGKQKGQDKLCVRIHRPPFNSQVCVTAKGKGDKKAAEKYKRDDLLRVSEVRKSRDDATHPSGLVKKK